jgi:hypothetical protein
MSESLLKLALRGLRYAWAAPCSAVGLVLGLVGCLFGASMRVRSGALEFGGGLAGELASRLPASFGFSAITFGHVILGVDHGTLAAVRAHEQVHVRQYERWGPLFVPAYLLSSLVQLMQGRDPYLDNRFEREARAKAPSAQPRTND